MRLDRVLAEVGCPDAIETFEPHWEQSALLLEKQGAFFLNPSVIRENAVFAGFDVNAVSLLLDAARRILGEPELYGLAWHCYRLAFECRDYDEANFARWPALDRHFPDAPHLFYLLIALAAVSLMRETHQAQGMDLTVTRETCADVRVNAAAYRARNFQRWGLEPTRLPWFRSHAWGELFHLGRFQFRLRPFGAPLHVFRNDETRETLALAGDGQRFNGLGFIDAEDSGSSTCWTATYDEGRRLSAGLGRVATGYPISPYGTAVRKSVSLPLKTWRPVLGADDLMLETHIPPGRSITPRRCRASMRRARDFFPAHFSDREFAGFCARAWLLNPQFSCRLDDDSNIVQFQRELYLFPAPSRGDEGLREIFGADRIDPDTAPDDTSLQRAMIDVIRSGNRLHTGGMFLLNQDLGHYGEQVYRAQWPPSVLREDRKPKT